MAPPSASVYSMSSYLETHSCWCCSVSISAIVRITGEKVGISVLVLRSISCAADSRATVPPRYCLIGPVWLSIVPSGFGRYSIPYLSESRTGPSLLHFKQCPSDYYTASRPLTDFLSGSHSRRPRSRVSQTEFSR